MHLFRQGSTRRDARAAKPAITADQRRALPQIAKLGASQDSRGLLCCSPITKLKRSSLCAIHSRFDFSREYRQSALGLAFDVALIDEPEADYVDDHV